MSPSARPATQSGAAPRASQATNPGPRAPPSTISATPATQNDGRCEFVPRLPRETKVDVSLCHACHVISRWMSPSAAPATHSGAAPRASRATNPGPRAPPSTISATPATQNDGRCEFVPRLPRETKVDVTKCHACHVTSRWMSPSATGDNSGPRAPPSTISATPATQNDGRCEFVPRLPRETKVDVSLCHACHVISRWMSPSATPATQSRAAPRASQATNPGPRAPPSTISATPATQNDGRCEFVPRLPRETKVDVTKCHACHVISRWMSPSATPDSLCVCVKFVRVKLLYVKFVCVKFVCVCSVCVCEVTKLWCERWYVTKLCVWVCVKLLYIKFVCVKFVCVKLLYVTFVCVKFVCVKCVC